MIECIQGITVNAENPDLREPFKMGLMQITSELMPQGKPAFLDVIKYPKVADLIPVYGYPTMMLLLSGIIRDFCRSLNVSRNMNDDQIIEAAAMLINECDNFRLQDYLMMFNMAKKGQLVKIYERIDLELITAILDNYYIMRQEAATKALESSYNELKGLGPTGRDAENRNVIDQRLESMGDRLQGALSSLKDALKDKL